MASMMDYLEWRGDLLFSADEFNEVDNLILSQLVYVDFEGIVEGEESSARISIEEASKVFWEMHEETEILKKVSMTKSAPFVLRKMAETERFKNAMLSKYVNDISDEEQSQFSVICVHLSDGSLYVAFSGTDNTIVGWHENFNMAYLTKTPGQQKAVAYLNKVVSDTDTVVRVGGHSKGGNLAVYAAVKCNAQIQEKIVQVYSNDGVGFRQDMLESVEYQYMMPKIRTILPESSFIGMLFEHQDAYVVVKSSQGGIQQHDMMTWEVKGNAFVYAQDIAVQSVLLDETLQSWIYQISWEERELLVETIFSILEEANIRTVDDFAHAKWKQIQGLIKERTKLAPETQKLFLKVWKLLLREGDKTMKKNAGKILKKK